ncbi:MAG: ABC transporter substrate-binding protein [Candidatus Pacebacteria bacterium]|nr:ABC transporter substrate-binding protein [Candidatus Paceibacterota bacterium]
MNKTGTIILIIIIIILVALGIWYGVVKKPVSAPESKETVKIGAILPLTGNSSFMGDSCRKSILLAQKQLAGPTKYNYQVLFEDDVMDSVKTSIAASKFINVDKVDVLISMSSGPGNVVSPMAQESKAIHFGLANDVNIAKGEYNFLHQTPPESEVQKFIQELQNRQISKIAIFMLNNEGGITILNEIKKQAQEKNIQIAYEVLLNPEQRDFKTEIAKAKAVNPQIIFVMLFPPQLEIIAKQLKELAAGIPLTSIQAFEFTQQPDLFEGYWYVQAADPTEKFTNEYQAEYNDTPKLSAPYCYDIFNLVVGAYEKTGVDGKKPTHEVIANALQQIKDFSGAVGKLSVLEGGIFWSDASLRMIKDGKPVTIK